MTFIVPLLLVVVIALLVLVIRIAADVQAIRRELLHDIRAALRDMRSHQRFGTATPIRILGHKPESPHGKLFSDDVGKVVWEWRGGEWIADAPDGIYPGLPPDFPGNFEGEKARK